MPGVLPPTYHLLDPTVLCPWLHHWFSPCWILPLVPLDLPWISPCSQGACLSSCHFSALGFGRVLEWATRPPQKEILRSLAGVGICASPLLGPVTKPLLFLLGSLVGLRNLVITLLVGLRWWKRSPHRESTQPLNPRHQQPRSSRQGVQFRPTFCPVLRTSCSKHSDWVVPELRVWLASSVLGLLVSGLVLFSLGCHLLRTDQVSLTSDLESTLSFELKALNAPRSANQRLHTGGWLETWRTDLQSPTLSHLRQRPGCTSQVPPLTPTTPDLRDGDGCPRWSTGVGRYCSGNGGGRALCAQLPRRACSWGNRRPQGAGPYETSRWHSACTSRRSFVPRNFGYRQLWRRRTGFWSKPGYKGGISCHGWRSGSAHRVLYQCGRGRLLCRCGAISSGTEVRRVSDIFLRRGVSLCIPVSRCSDCSGKKMASFRTRGPNGFLHSSRRGSGDTASYTYSQKAYPKEVARRGFSFRRWSKAKAGHNRLFGRQCGADHAFTPQLDAEAGCYGGAPSDFGGAGTVLGKSGPICPGPAVRIYLEFAIPDFEGGGKSCSSSSQNCDKTEPWYVGFSCYGNGCGPGGASTRQSGRLGLVCPDFRQCPGQSSLCPKPGPHDFGLSDSPGSVRSNDGIDRWEFSQHSRCSRPGSSTGRACCSQGQFLQVSGNVYGQENDTYSFCRDHLPGDGGQRDQRPALPRALRRLRKAEGIGPAAVSSHDGLRLLDGGQHCSGYGLHSLAGGDTGASVAGQRPDGLGHAPMPSRRSSSIHLREQAAELNFKSKGICSLSRPEVGHLRVGFPQGDGGDQFQTPRTHRGAFEDGWGSFSRWAKSKGKTKAKGATEEKGRRKGSDPARRTRGLVDPDMDAAQRIADGGQVPSPLKQTLDFCTWAICLPRWIAKCRTNFGWHLKRSFAAVWRCKASPTTTFPLPAPHPGCFAGSGPNLSRKRLISLARRRLLHVTIYCLNYLYLGRHPSDEELGRCPNDWQRSCFARLRALLFVCGDGQEEFPIVPGRSGPELVHAICQMEAFLNLHPDLNQSYVQHGPQKFREDPNVLPVDQNPELAPYKNLNAGRLKLVGQGLWPMEDFMDGPLWLPYVEPRFLLHGQSTSGAQVPNFQYESKEENLALAKLWDKNGLLWLARKPICEGHFSRVFNAHKSDTVDRQIGDRRIPNSRERRLDGPSRHLPPGFLLTNLQVAPFREQVIGSVTDRRDFYHQAKVSASRAESNMLPFRFSEEELADCSALQAAIHREALTEKRKSRREQTGDGFGNHDGVADDGLRKEGWFASFSSLFQGDHLGVEFALQSHQQLLADHGLLLDDRRLKGHAIFPLSRQWEALIIDDYFAVGTEPVNSEKINSFAAKALAKARQIYGSSGLLGSPEKDVEAASRFKAAGAEINSDISAVKLGVTTVGAPLSKRIALASLSLRAGQLGFTSSKILSRLAGNWCSVLLYRRCMTSIIDNLFAEASAAEAFGANTAVPLSQKIREELCILSALSPLAVSNIATKYSSKVFASDASLGMGAVVSTHLPPSVVEAIWLGSDKKGCYTRLDSAPKALLAAASVELDNDGVDDKNFGLSVGPYRSPLLYYDFVEFYGGSGRVSDCMRSLGHAVAPPLDLSSSAHYDMTSLRLLEWCMHMIESGRFASFLSEPPCTTFSAAAYPPVRSYKQPEGFSRTCPKTHLGNTLAFRSFVLLKHGRRFRRPCGKEQPRLSKMAWLSFWKTLLDLGFEESVLASCQFGSPHRKEFRFITYLLDSCGLEVKCPGGHPHVRIEGRFTKDSAVYTWDLSRHVAKYFSKALAMVRREAADETFELGLESVVTNDILTSCTWKREKAWRWSRKSHINVLESHAGVATLDIAARTSPDSRFINLVDSQVAKGALAKGRSTSTGLQATCKRSAAIQLAAGLYPGWTYAPTRLNVADDPTRHAVIRSPCSRSFLGVVELTVLQRWHSVSLRRHAANWCRLVILLNAFGLSDASANFDCSSPCLTSWTFPTSVLSSAHHCLSVGFSHFLCVIISVAMLLAVIGSSIVCSSHWTFPTAPSTPQRRTGVVSRVAFGRTRRFGFCLVFTLCVASTAAMVPASRLEEERAFRRADIDLLPTRVARKQTLDYRQKLLTDFGVWLHETHGVQLSVLLSAKPPDAEEVAKFLVSYGQQMFISGKAYGKFAETINAVANARPVIRKQLVSAWDLCFAWLADEPYQHHPALPLSVLLGIVATGLIWGWPLECAIFSLTWAGILRIGEVLLADRSDLILPRDAAPGVTYALLRIKMPKTRGRAAKHQAAKVDPPDIVELLDAVFCNHRPDQMLWPYSASTLRKRFKALLEAVGLNTSRSSGIKPFDLGSLRPGGATFLLLRTEDGELVRRRGRWVSIRVMEIYLQEVQYTTCTERIDPAANARIKILAGAFPAILTWAINNLRTGIPTPAWFQLFQTRDSQELG